MIKIASLLIHYCGNNLGLCFLAHSVLLLAQHQLADTTHMYYTSW